MLLRLQILSPQQRKCR